MGCRHVIPEPADPLLLITQQPAFPVLRCVAINERAVLAWHPHRMAKQPWLLGALKNPPFGGCGMWDVRSEACLPSNQLSCQASSTWFPSSCLEGQEGLLELLRGS